MIVSPMNTSSKPVNADDVAGVRFLDFDALACLRNGKCVVILPLVLRAVAVNADGGIADFDFAAVEFCRKRYGRGNRE